MVSSVPANWGRSSPNSWLARRRQRRTRHPDAFDCGLRVVAGTVDGERTRWRYQLSAVDPLRQGEVVSLQHGSVQLRVVGGEVLGAGDRPKHVRIGAVVVDTEARVELCFDADELWRFGLA